MSEAAMQKRRLDMPAANEPSTSFVIPAANERMRAGRALTVEIVQIPGEVDAEARRSFWALLGDLVADVLLDGVDGAWGSAEELNQEILTP